MTDRIGKIGITALMCLAFTVVSCGEPTAPEDAGPISLKIVGGNEQTAVVGTELPEPLMVKATNHRGRPLRRYLVNFVVTKGDGSVFAGAAMTNWRGYAQDWWTMGSEPGENVVEVRAVNSWTGEKQVFGTFTATAVPVPVGSVEVTPETAALQLIAVPTAQLEVAVKDKDGNPLDREVAWSSNREDIATVNDDGLVTAVGEGEAEITASSGGESDFATITVDGAPVYSVVVVPDDFDLVLGGDPEEQQLVVTLWDENGDQLFDRTVTFSDDPTGVVTVSPTGLVTAVEAGDATITVESEGVETTATVTVTDPVPATPDEYEANNHYSLASSLGQIDLDDPLSIQANVYPGTDADDWYHVTASETSGVCVDGSESFEFTVTLTDIPEGSDYNLELYLNPIYFLAWAPKSGNLDETVTWGFSGTCGTQHSREFLIRVNPRSGPPGGDPSPYTLSMVLSQP
jgi:hypothetical protein